MLLMTDVDEREAEEESLTVDRQAVIPIRSRAGRRTDGQFSVFLLFMSRRQTFVNYEQGDHLVQTTARSLT